MQATPLSSFAATPARRTGLIAVVVVAILAAAAALFEPGSGSRAATLAEPQAAAGTMVPAGTVGETPESGDPSVPSAASVFRDGQFRAEEPPVSF